MQARIYRTASRLKKHATTALIALVVSSLGGAGGAYAASQINFSQINGKVASSQIREGVVDYNNLTFPLRHKIDLIELAASNEALNAVPQVVLAQVDRDLESLEQRIEAGYVHK